MRLFVIVAFLLLAGFADASTTTVCHSGCDYSSIQAAIDAASRGDTINVQSGAYDEQVIINKDVQVRGVGGTVGISTLYKCGHETTGSFAGVIIGGCQESSTGKIGKVTVTVGGETISGDSGGKRAAEVLGTLHNSTAIGPLIKLLNDTDSNVQQHAVESLGKMGTLAVKPLIHALNDTNSTIRLNAASALEKIGDSSAVIPLILALNDSHPSVRLHAAMAFRNIKDPRAEEAYKEYMER